MGEELEPYGAYVPSPNEPGATWAPRVAATIQIFNDQLVTNDGAIQSEIERALEAENALRDAIDGIDDGNNNPDDPDEDLAPLRVSDAAGSWWCDPSGVRRTDATRGISETYVTGIGRDGEITVSKVNHRANTVQRVVIGHASTGDDHNTPAILSRFDRTRPLVVAWNNHNRENKLYVRRAKYAWSIDLDQWYDTQTITFPSNLTTSYAMIYEERNVPGNLHLFTRCEGTGFDGSYFYTRSTDDGATWTTPIEILAFGTGQHAYMSCTQLNWEATGANSTLRVVIYGHPDSSSLHEIRSFEIRLDTGEVRASGSTVANIKTPANLPVGATSLPIAYSPPGGKNIRLFDISNRRLIGPEIAFCEWTQDQDAAPWDGKYYVLVYDGSAWQKRLLANTGGILGHRGSAHYHGGMIFPGLPDGAGGVVYTSRESNGEWIIEKWNGSGGNGLPTWTPQEIARSTNKLGRPIALDYHPSDLGGRVGGWEVAWRDFNYYSAADNGYNDVLADTTGGFATGNVDPDPGDGGSATTSITAFGSTTATGTGTTTLTLPGGVQAGDVAFLTRKGGNSTSISAGWTLVQSGIATYVKVLGAGETTVTVTAASGTLLLEATVFRGVNATVPIAANSAPSSVTSGGSIGSAAAVATTNSSMGISIVAASVASTPTLTAPDGSTVVGSATSSVAGISVATLGAIDAGGSTGALTWTVTPDTTSAAVINIVLNPA